MPVVMWEGESRVTGNAESPGKEMYDVFVKTGISVEDRRHSRCRSGILGDFDCTRQRVAPKFFKSKFEQSGE